MSLINKYDASLPIYSNCNFVGYSLTGMVVVMLIEEGLIAVEPQYRGISGNVIAVNYGNKKPISLPFNPIYMYAAFIAVIIYVITLKYAKFK